MLGGVSIAQQVVERLHAVPGNHDFVFDVVLLERAQGQQFVVGIVLHQKNRLLVHCTAPYLLASASVK